MASLAARRAKPGFSRIAFEVILHLEGIRRQHVAQVGSALVEQDGRDRIAKRICANDRHSRTLAGEFDPSVERLLLKRAPSRPGKINGDPAKSTPPAHSRTPFTLPKTRTTPRASPTILF